MKQIFAAAVLTFSIYFSFAQVITPEQYIAKYKDIAIREMKRMGVPASITLAQGLLETESGNSVLVKKSNNHFGIKCKSTWTADVVSHTDDAPDECFRVYKTPEDSYRDHSNFLRGGDRYAFLFSLDPLDYKGWAYGLKKAGYATNNKYPEILIKNIEQYNLQQYSLEGAKDMPDFNSSLFRSDPEKTVSVEVPEDKSVKENVNPVNATGMYYEVKPKEGLYSIAKKFGVKVDQLKDWNNLSSDSLKIGQQLIISK